MYRTEDQEGVLDGRGNFGVLDGRGNFWIHRQLGGNEAVRVD